MKRIYLIDCPGITMPEGDEADIVLRGVVRVENIESPQQYIPRLLERVRKQHLERTYEISGWEDATDFLAVLGRKGGRLLKGGEIDESGGTYTFPELELINSCQDGHQRLSKGKDSVVHS